MKKIIYNEFGTVDVLELATVSQPEPGEKQVLVKVKSVSLNPLDWKLYSGEA
ncbi:MAG: NAD(P)-dependent alcohol dehydrogenase, partial [Rhizobacter sp.]|nr:NAD(P)-dependent alcohol dehydrogenase [Ferruginibacter sp.]